MIPGIHLIHTLAIIRLFHHVGRMLQRKSQLMAIHREDIAQLVGHGVQGGRLEMGGLTAESHIVNQITTGHDGQLRLQEQGRLEDGLKISLACGRMATESAHRASAQTALRYELLQLPLSLSSIQKRIVLIPFLHYPTP